MDERTIQTLREALFAQLEELSDKTAPIDVVRHRLRVQVSQAIIDAARIEVELAAVLKGALDVPFIESQAKDRGLPPPPKPQALTPMEKTAQVLAGGPPSDHPWRARAKD